MKLKALSSPSLFTLIVVIIAVSASYIYAFLEVTQEVETDSEKLLNYVEHKLLVAQKSLEELNKVDFTGCDHQGQETLEAFLFDHLGAGLFLIRHKSSAPWTYCSVVGSIVVSQRDRSFDNLVYLDETKHSVISVMGYDWQGIEKRDLFLSLESKDRINAVRIAVEDSYTFFEEQCSDCRQVELRLSNNDLIFELGKINSGILTNVRVFSSTFPLYVDAGVGRKRVRQTMLGSLFVTIPISTLFTLLCFYIINLVQASHRGLDYQLKIAVKRGELLAFYQPIIDAKTGYVIGAEALVRWVKPDGSIEPPGRFIQTLEEGDLIDEVTIQLLKNIPSDLAEILTLSPDFRCSINLVPQHLESPYFYEQLSLLSQQGFPCHQLAIEITERHPLKNLSQAGMYVEKIKALGVCIELDDAGTGYGGASYLQELNIDVMKIDKLFVDTLIFSPDRTQVLDANIQMAQMLGMQIIAEGVEDASQSEALLEKGVRFQQGFLFAKPMPAADFIAFWQTSHQAYTQAFGNMDAPNLHVLKEE